MIRRFGAAGPGNRLALYEEAGHLLVADVPTIFLYHRTSAVLVKPFVTGYVATPVDFWPGKQTLLIIDVAHPRNAVQFAPHANTFRDRSSGGMQGTTGTG